MLYEYFVGGAFVTGIANFGKQAVSAKEKAPAARRV
jgi:hypothetical protein